MCVCVSGCDPQLYENTLQLRERRLDVEALLMEEKRRAEALKEEQEVLLKKVRPHFEQCKDLQSLNIWCTTEGWEVTLEVITSSVNVFRNDLMLNVDTVYTVCVIFGSAAENSKAQCEGSGAGPGGNQQREAGEDE